jgi:urea transport system substrate-binding protein
MSGESPARDPALKNVPPPPSSEVGDTLVPGTDSSGEIGTDIDYTRFLSPPQTSIELGWLAHYRILKLLGRGGMGVVFQAEDMQLQRLVALKAILPEFAANSVARQRFLREARACAALKSDHVVTIYQVGQDRDLPFLAMEFLQGQTLETRLQGERLPLREVLRIGRESAAGLAAAHARGLIHRDVKPANIWLEAPTGRVKLLDFGLARATGSRSDLTQMGRIVGTPEFMSPEQARGEDVDARSDLFSLGAVLYALCTGQKPFQGTSVMAVLTALAVRTPRPIYELNADVPQPLVTLIGCLLEKDPADRLFSAEEVRQVLEGIEAELASPADSGSRPRTQIIPAAVPTAVAQPPLAAPRPPRRLRTAGVLAGVVLIGAALLAAGLHFWPRGGPGGTPAVPSGPPIRIGVLHSRTGTMAVSERPVIDAVLFAVEEINEQGGLLGRPVEAVLADGQSDEIVFAGQAEKLIRDDRVCTIFGCWTSASRKAVVPVIERHDHLLIYPVQYEGMEQSPNVVYGGLVPNQQILPALRWLVGFEGKRRWFLVGSDYVFPVTANAVIRDEAKARGSAIVGEEYLLLGSTDVAGVVQKILQAHPDLLINTINGDTNVAFFRALRRAGIKSKDIPTLSFSISEEELSALGPRDTEGDYVAANYFQSLDTFPNQEFVRRFRKRYGAERVLSSPMETAYAGVHLWSKAVQAAGRDEPRAIRETIRGQEYEAPQGLVRIDPATAHTVQIARVGRIDETGRLMEVFRSPQSIAPEPFPSSRSQQDWGRFLDGIHKRWGGRWSNPGP